LIVARLIYDQLLISHTGHSRHREGILTRFFSMISVRSARHFPLSYTGGAMGAWLLPAAGCAWLSSLLRIVVG
jgi:hypothetical protein